MRILILNQAFYPDVVATAQHASDFAAALVERGHDVTVVCGRRAYDNPAVTYPAREIWRGVHIRRIGALGLGKGARWKRAADFGSYIANCTLHLAALPRFDVVMALTSPPLISWLGAVFTAVTGGRFVFWVMDLNPDEAIAAGWLRADSWIGRRLSGLLQYSLEKATAIVALDRFMAERIERKGIPAERIVTLPPWSHDHVLEYDEAGRDAFRAQHGLSNKFVVMYSGNHSPCHPLTTLLDAARAMQERDDIAFCFIGGGSEFATVKQYAADHGLRNVTTLPYQPLERLGASLSSADLHTVVMGDPFVGLVHPCKVYNIRTLGIPYLYIGPAESHVTDIGPTWAARHGDVSGVVAQILAAANSGSNRTEAADDRWHSQRYLVGRLAATLETAGMSPLPSRAAVRAQ